MISDYSGLSFFEINDLDFDVYKLLLRDGFIHGLEQTKEGREYLKNAWILEQTEPDRKKLRDNFNNKTP